MSGPYKFIKSFFKPATKPLVKLFIFGAYFRARGRSNKTIEEELVRFPYQRKKALQPPYFTPVDLSKKHDRDIFPALTDVGLCNVYNGDAMASTYSNSAKNSELVNLLDPRESFKPRMITGTGKVSERTFWLNVADREVNTHFSLFQYQDEQL